MKEKSTKSNTISKPKKAGSSKKQDAFNIPPLAIVGAIVILALVVFFPMLQNQFTSWDDTDYITQNPKIWTLNGESVKYLFTHPMALNYHPFTMLSLALNYHFSQLNPFSYYLVNLILHLLNIVLVFRFVQLLSKNNIHVAAFTALIFAIHPMHVESVAWASERKDVLYTLFFMGALITYYHFLETKKFSFYVATFLLALCAMFSKPAAIIFPLLMLAIEYYREPKINFKLILDKIPFFIMAAIFMYLTFNAQKTDTTEVGEFTKYSVFQRFFLVNYGFITYFIKLFIPFQLAAFHPYPSPLGATEYLSPILVGVLLLSLVFFKKQRKIIGFGLLFYFINLLLVLQFVSIGSAIIAERYTYVSYIGLCFAIGMLIFEYNKKLSPKMVWTIVLIWSAVFAYQARARVLVWHNTITLWTDMIEKYPHSDRGYYGRANQYERDGDHEKAIADFTKAIIETNNYKSYTNRGAVYYRTKRYQEAIDDYTKSLAAEPNQKNAVLGRGYAYFKLKKYEEALKDANQSISMQPDYDGYIFRFTVYRDMERNEEAFADFKMAASLTSDMGIYNQRGSLYFKLGEYEKAIEDYNLTLSKNGNDALALSNKAAALFILKRYEEAFPDAVKSWTLDPNIQNNYKTLAYLYEKRGNKAKAKEFAEKALKFGLVLNQDFLNVIK